MADSISFKPNCAIPYPQLKFVEGSKENYKNGYVQKGIVCHNDGKYKIIHEYIPNKYGEDIIRQIFKGENKYGELFDKEYTKEGDTIQINRSKIATYIKDLKTGFLRPITTEEKEKLLNEGIKLDADSYMSKEIRELLCKENERLVQEEENIILSKKDGGKWIVENYRLGDLCFSNRRGMLNDVPEQTDIIDKKAYKAIANFVENLAKKFKRV